MSDQRRTDHSQPEPEVATDFVRRNAGARENANHRRFALYAVAALFAILAFAWIDGGAEPLHPITQSVELKSHKSGAH